MSVVGKISAKQIMAMVERQKFRCAISGREMTPETASLDHITPLARGGKHELGNVWAVDHQVNTAKGTLSVEEFVAMCFDVVRHQEAIRGSLTPSESGGGPGG
jgi:5-methylcytosine-specific restriction endonuclease McrA